MKSRKNFKFMVKSACRKGVISRAYAGLPENYLILHQGTASILQAQKAGSRINETMRKSLYIRFFYDNEG